MLTRTQFNVLAFFLTALSGVREDVGKTAVKVFETNSYLVICVCEQT